MSWSNLNPSLVYALLGLIVFLILVAYVATREENPFINLDTKKYSSTIKIKSTLLIPLAAWIDEQSDNFDEIADKLGLSTEMLDSIIKGRVDLVSIDVLIDLLIKTGHQVDIKSQRINMG